MKLGSNKITGGNQRALPLKMAFGRIRTRTICPGHGGSEIMAIGSVAYLPR